MMTIRPRALSLRPGDRVLDLGCGEGRHVHGLALIDGLTVVGLDMDLASLATARAGLAMVAPPPTSGEAPLRGFVAGDAARLPFADASFTAVVCSEVLEHLPDPDAALAEIARVLAPGGRFVATVPRAWPEAICWRLASGPGGYADQPGGHVRIFAEPALRRQITNAGFVWQARHGAHALHTPYWWLKCALWRRRDDHPLVRIYHRLLVWDLMSRPRVTRIIEAIADPVIGKSVALYFRKAAAA